ncbi:transposable element Tcb2 transposase [Trichonephila clavipes]|nr:transposable element Tcb2 transposase [Trichonephila clavipes]
MMEAGWSARREARQLGRSNCVRTASSAAIQAQVAPSQGAYVAFRTIRRRLAAGHLGSQHPLRVLPLTPTHRRLRLEWCRARRKWIAAEWNQVVFSDESRFNLSSDNNCVRVWRTRGKRLNPAFVLQPQTVSTADVMLTQQGCHKTVSALLLPFLGLPDPKFVSVRAYVYHLGRRVGFPTSLNELEARLQKIWNEMSHDIIQNLYASMPDRMASCIRARGGKTEY